MPVSHVCYKYASIAQIKFNFILLDFLKWSCVVLPMASERFAFHFSVFCSNSNYPERNCTIVCVIFSHFPLWIKMRALSLRTNRTSVGSLISIKWTFNVTILLQYSPLFRIPYVSASRLHLWCITLPVCVFVIFHLIIILPLIHQWIFYTAQNRHVFQIWFCSSHQYLFVVSLKLRICSLSIQGKTFVLFYSWHVKLRLFHFFSKNKNAKSNKFLSTT